jgi:hypothetical protein
MAWASVWPKKHPSFAEKSIAKIAPHARLITRFV